MVHAFVAGLPQTSQSCSAAAECGGGSAGSADAADEEAGAGTDAAGEGGGTDASGEEASTAAEPERGFAGVADDELVLEEAGADADANAEEAGADADATAEEAGADAGADAGAVTDAAAAGEAGVGEEGRANDGIVAVDEPVAALVCFPPFFFVMGWCVGVLEARSMSSSRG